MERDNEPLRVYEELVSHLTPLTSEREARKFIPACEDEAY